MRFVAIVAFTLWDSFEPWSRPWLPLLGLGHTPNIPQFILDARHPWIERNRGQLWRMPNASIYLCQVDSVLSIDDPILDDLFRRLEIDNNRVGISRYGWRNALDRLLEMQNCPAALERAETLHVDIFIHRNREPLNPPSELLGLFALVLDSMPNLRTII